MRNSKTTWQTHDQSHCKITNTFMYKKNVANNNHDIVQTHMRFVLSEAGQFQVPPEADCSMRLHVTVGLLTTSRTPPTMLRSWASCMVSRKPFLPAPAPVMTLMACSKAPRHCSFSVLSSSNSIVLVADFGCLFLCLHFLGKIFLQLLNLSSVLSQFRQSVSLFQSEVSRLCLWHR